MIEIMLSELAEIFQRRGITKEETEIIWLTMRALCARQVLERKGDFFEVIKDLLYH